jgi:hypothetical protein
MAWEARPIAAALAAEFLINSLRLIFDSFIVKRFMIYIK